MPYSPRRFSMTWTANITAFIPDAHIMFTVNAGTVTGRPAPIPTCRAMFIPCPARQDVAHNHHVHPLWIKARQHRASGAHSQVGGGGVFRKSAEKLSVRRPLGADDPNGFSIHNHATNCGESTLYISNF